MSLLYVSSPVDLHVIKGPILVKRFVWVDDLSRQPILSLSMIIFSMVGPKNNNNK